MTRGQVQARRRVRDVGHAVRYARVWALGVADELADVVGTDGLSCWLHDRWLLAGLAWEWRLSPDRVGRDLFAVAVRERSARHAQARSSATGSSLLATRGGSCNGAQQ